MSLSEADAWKPLGRLVKFSHFAVCCLHRESAVAELRSTAASDEERQNMQEILRRVHDNDDGGAAMAAVLGMPPIGDTGATSGGRDDNSGSGSASDEDDVTAEAPLSVATLQRLLAAAEAGEPPRTLSMWSSIESWKASGRVNIAYMHPQVASWTRLSSSWTRGSCASSSASLRLAR